MKKKNKLFSVLLILILTGALALSSVPVHADEEINNINTPTVYLRPDFVAEDGSYEIYFTATIYGEYDSIRWQYQNVSLDGTLSNWNTFNSVSGTSYHFNISDLSVPQRNIRVLVSYNTGTSTDVVYSNVVSAYNENISTPSQITIFSNLASTLLYRFLEWFNIFLAFMLDNPIVFVGLVMTLIIIAIGTLRHLIGGSNEKEICSI